jgi:hypothetical protein
MSTKLQRFPRLLTGAQAAALTHLFWTEPETPRIKVARDGKSISFRFKVYIRPEVPQRLWSFFLAQPTHNFEKALKEAYERTQSGKKPVHRHISNFLHRALQNTLRDWVQRDEFWPDEQRKAELEVFEKLAKIKPGPQIDPSNALKAARLFSEYHTSIKAIKTDLRKTVRPRLREVIRKHTSPELVLTALRQMADPEASLELISNVDPTDLAYEIVKSQMPDVDFKKVSIKTYVNSGKRLLGALQE